MNRILQHLNSHPTNLYWAAALLLIPALFWNLGLNPVTADEKYRALVALEMQLNNNFLVPTNYGEYYYNKPPLYNWLLIGCYKLFGGENEFSMRMPTVLALLGFAITLFFTSRKYLSSRSALLVSFFFVTMSRMLYYDALIGLIDTLFAWVTYLSFFVVYHYYRKEKMAPLYLVSYLLMAIGIMLKGLPSIAFQGITLLTVFLAHKDFKRLFSLYNFLGLFMAAGLVGSYFWIYNSYNDVSNYFTRLFSESSNRFEPTFLDTLSHVASFPFTSILAQILPWSLFALLLVQRQSWRVLREHHFLKIMGLIFLANILIYWLAPETRPRYLFMLYPIIFLVLAHLHEQSALNNLWRKLAERFMFGVAGGIVVAVVLPIFLVNQELWVEWNTINPNLAHKLIIGAGALAPLVFFMYRLREHRLMITVIFLLGLRILFNVTVLPIRASSERDAGYKAMAIEVAELTKGKPLIMDEWLPLNEMQGYYIAFHRQEVLKRRTSPFQPNKYYIVRDQDVKSHTFEVHMSFINKYQEKPLHVVTLRNE